MAPISLYIVEDELIIAHDLRAKLSEFGYNVLGIDTKGESAIESIASLQESNIEPDIVIMDVGLAGKMDGIEAARILTENYNCGIIFLTSMNKSEMFTKSFSLKPYAYLLNRLISIRSALPLRWQIISATWKSPMKGSSRNLKKRLSTVKKLRRNAI